VLFVIITIITIAVVVVCSGSQHCCNHVSTTIAMGEQLRRVSGSRIQITLRSVDQKPQLQALAIP
jgi:hypothetical protein